MAAPNHLYRQRQVRAPPDILPAGAEELLARAAQTSAPVLIEGETGTGKTYLARSIHQTSARAGGPFVRVDCAALPDGLIERELFGHVRGAYTGALDSRPGLVEAASGGTLFLDEIGEVPMPVQSKLLSMLEEQAIRRLGAVTEIPVDIRIISATNQDLAELVAQRAFRRDLYYRCRVLYLRLPPLRERRRELPCDRALSARTHRFQAAGRRPTRPAGDHGLNQGAFLELVDIPEFGTVYPSERDVEQMTAELAPIVSIVPQPMRAKLIEEFRHRPQGRILRGGEFQVDRADRLWVATTRPSQVGTHLAVFQRSRYLGNIEIPGRVLNFQIADSLLVVLVEELEPDGDGLYPRRLDWYRIVER